MTEPSYLKRLGIVIVMCFSRGATGFAGVALDKATLHGALENVLRSFLVSIGLAIKPVTLTLAFLDGLTLRLRLVFPAGLSS